MILEKKLTELMVCINQTEEKIKEIKELCKSCNVVITFEKPKDPDSLPNIIRKSK